MPERRLQTTRHASHTLLTAHAFDVAARRLPPAERPAMADPASPHRVSGVEPPSWNDGFPASPDGPRPMTH